MDEKGKLFGKVSIVDILFVLLVVIGLVGAFFMINKIKDGAVLSDGRSLLSSNTATSRIQVTLLIKDIRNYSVDSIHVGDEVYDLDTGKPLGEVVEIQTGPSEQMLTTLDGQTIYADMPGKYDVSVIVEMAGSRTETGFATASNQHLVYGSQLGIKTTRIQTIPTVVSIQEVNEAGA